MYPSGQERSWGPRQLQKLYFLLQSAGPSGATANHPARPGPHRPRPREAPTWGPASSGAVQPGVSTAWAAARSAVAGSGSSTSAMGGADARGREASEPSQEGAAPLRVRTAPACPAASPRPGAARSPGHPPTRVPPPRSAGDPSPQELGRAWAGRGRCDREASPPPPRFPLGQLPRSRAPLARLPPQRGGPETGLQGPLRPGVLWETLPSAALVFKLSGAQRCPLWEPGVEDSATGLWGFRCNRFGNLSAAPPARGAGSADPATPGARLERCPHPGCAQRKAGGGLLAQRDGGRTPAGWDLRCTFWHPRGPGLHVRVGSGGRPGA